MEGSRQWSSEETEELLLLTLAMTKKRKNKWVHETNMKRPKFGKSHHLVQELSEDEKIYKQYFRLSSTQFTEVLSIIQDDIKKQTIDSP